MSEVKERCFVCIDCGDEFWSPGVFAERCPICRTRHHNEQKAQWLREMNKSPHKAKKRRRKRHVSLEEFMHECAQYNREHGTDLNYGTYDRLLRRERGELAVEVKL